MNLNEEQLNQWRDKLKVTEADLAARKTELDKQRKALPEGSSVPELLMLDIKSYTADKEEHAQEKVAYWKELERSRAAAAEAEAAARSGGAGPGPGSARLFLPTSSGFVRSWSPIDVERLAGHTQLPTVAADFASWCTARPDALRAFQTFYWEQKGLIMQLPACGKEPDKHCYRRHGQLAQQLVVMVAIADTDAGVASIDETTINQHPLNTVLSVVVDSEIKFHNTALASVHPGRKPDFALIYTPQGSALGTLFAKDVMLIGEMCQRVPDVPPDTNYTTQKLSQCLDNAGRTLADKEPACDKVVPYEVSDGKVSRCGLAFLNGSTPSTICGSRWWAADSAAAFYDQLLLAFVVYGQLKPLLQAAAEPTSLPSHCAQPEGAPVVAVGEVLQLEVQELPVVHSNSSLGSTPISSPGNTPCNSGSSPSSTLNSSPGSTPNKAGSCLGDNVNSSPSNTPCNGGSIHANTSNNNCWSRDNISYRNLCSIASSMRQAVRVEGTFATRKLGVSGTALVASGTLLADGCLVAAGRSDVVVRLQSGASFGGWQPTEVQQCDREHAALQQLCGAGAPYLPEMVAYGVVAAGQPGIIGAAALVTSRLGCPLQEHLAFRRCQTMAADFILILAASLSAACGVLMAAKVFHCDIRPDNITVTLSHLNRCSTLFHLIDLGAACCATLNNDCFRNKHGYSVGQDLSRQPVVMDNNFSSLEALTSQPLLPLADLQAVVYTLVFLASGSLPWMRGGSPVEGRRRAMADAGGWEGLAVLPPHVASFAAWVLSNAQREDVSIVEVHARTRELFHVVHKELGVQLPSPVSMPSC